MICRSFNLFSQKHANRFVLLPYHSENNEIPVATTPTGFGALRTLAVSRLFLDIRINHIVRGQRAITTDTALRLSRYLGTRPAW